MTVLTAKIGQGPSTRWMRGIVRSATVRIIGKRALQAVPVLWGVSFIIFCLMNLLPGDAASALLGLGATAQEDHALKVKLHLDQPFFVRYIHWLQSALTGHLGNSLASGTSVSGIIWQRLPVTLELVLFAFIISLFLAVPVAVLAARRPRGFLDRFSIIINMVGYSVPNFVLALIIILVFAVHLGVLPALGFTPIGQDFGQNIRSMVLPGASLGFALFCGYVRLLRADLIDQMKGQDYILTAQAKGAGHMQVLIQHALRNSLFSLLTIIGLNLGTLIGGTVILESIFALPGMGQQLLQAIQNRDVPLVQGIVVLMATAIVLSNLIVDILYAVLDPRIRYGRSSS